MWLDRLVIAFLGIYGVLALFLPMRAWKLVFARKPVPDGKVAEPSARSLFLMRMVGAGLIMLILFAIKRFRIF